MKNWITAALLLVALAIAAWTGHHVAALSGERDLAAAQLDWAK